jgi:hypothetical protein
VLPAGRRVSADPFYDALDRERRRLDIRDLPVLGWSWVREQRDHKDAGDPRVRVHVECLAPTDPRPGLRNAILQVPPVLEDRPECFRCERALA